MNETTAVTEYDFSTIESYCSEMVDNQQTEIEQNKNIIDGLALGYKLVFVIFILLVIIWLYKFFTNIFN